MSQSELPKDLIVEPKTRIIVEQVLQGLLELSRSDASSQRSVTSGQSKDYFQFLELVKKAVDDYQRRQKPPDGREISLSWERPDSAAETEKISISLLERGPGAFSKGAPLEGQIKNWAPILREKRKDPENPGYLNLVFGKLYDNKICFTTWAQTNKEAIERAFWFEELMENYTWFFRASGVGRVLFLSQEEDIFIDEHGKRVYGRKLVYFIRTEKITVISEKTIEDIVINLSVGKSS